MDAAHVVHPVVVTDVQALAACRDFLDDQRVLVEPACGAALAAVHAMPPALQAAQRVLVVVCGGVTASAETVMNAQRG